MSDLETYLFTPDDLPGEGADVRVRPEPVRAVSYGQGSPLKGPIIQGKQFIWGAPLTVDCSCPDGIGDPEQGRVHLATIQASPELFMSEINYQQYHNETEE